MTGATPTGIDVTSSGPPRPRVRRGSGRRPASGGARPAADPVALAVVDAPTALAAFQLVLRLPRSRSRSARDDADRWAVDVPVQGRDAIKGLLRAVRLWLRGEQIAETCVRVGSDVYHVRAASAVRSDTRRNR